MHHECAFEPRKLMAAVSHLAAENERLTRENERLLREGASPAAAPTAHALAADVTISVGPVRRGRGGVCDDDVEPHTSRGSRKTARRSLGPGLAID